MPASDEPLFEHIQVGDAVFNEAYERNSLAFRDPAFAYAVIAVSEKQFICDIGYNEATGQRMHKTFRKLDGRSVGGRSVHFVRPVCVVATIAHNADIGMISTCQRNGRILKVQV